MIKGHTLVAIIPARGGSKGIKDKNITELAGRPLISWTIEAAQNSRFIDEIVVSTNSSDIAEIAKCMGCDVPFIRPEHLASDTSTTVDTVLHALSEICHYDICIVLQPTSPLRTASDIDAAITLLVEGGRDSCVSVALSDKSPYWMFSLDKNECLIPVIQTNDVASRRQDLDDAYVLNGAIYIIRTQYLMEEKRLFDRKSIAYIMSKERSIDIDDAFDLQVAEMLLNQQQSGA